MSNVSAVTPCNLINTSRTAAGAAASSTANPNFNQNIVTWTLPNAPTSPLWQTSQSFSTKAGEVFTDMCSGQIVAPGLDTSVTSPALFTLLEGVPKNTCD